MIFHVALYLRPLVCIFVQFNVVNCGPLFLQALSSTWIYLCNALPRSRELCEHIKSVHICGAKLHCLSVQWSSVGNHECVKHEEQMLVSGRANYWPAAPRQETTVHMAIGSCTGQRTFGDILAHGAPWWGSFNLTNVNGFKNRLMNLTYGCKIYFLHLSVTGHTFDWRQIRYLGS